MVTDREKLWFGIVATKGREGVSEPDIEDPDLIRPQLHGPDAYVIFQLNGTWCMRAEAHFKNQISVSSRWRACQIV